MANIPTTEPSTIHKPLLATLKGERQAVPPIWIMRQAGRYLPEYRAVRAKAGSFMDLCLNPDHAVEVTLQPIRRYGFDGSILFSDILMVPYGLGQDVRFLEGEGPSLPPIREPAGVATLNRRDFHQRVAPVYETVRRLRQDLPPTVTLLGFCGAPWTVAAYMVEGHGSKDWMEAKRFAYTQPQAWASLLDTLVDTSIDYLSAQIDAGADAVQIFDSWAGALSEPDFQAWVIEPNRRIVAGLKQRHPATPVICFPRGAGLLLESFAETVNPAALGLDTSVPAAWAVRQLQRRWCLQGNLDPIRLLAGGEPLFGEVRRLLDLFRGGPYVFNLGHGILQQTNPDTVAELVATIRRHGQAG